MNGQMVGNGQQRDEVSRADLVLSAATGDEAAWEAIVDRYGGLIWHVARVHRLGESEAVDVVRITWRRLVQHLARIRDPEAVDGWVVSVARRESLRALRLAGRECPTLNPADPSAQAYTIDANGMLWTCTDGFPEHCRALLRVLTTEPPVNYQRISAVLNPPTGALAATRPRCMQHLRHSGDRVGATA
ncbi:MAG: RNA polymerase sigma factor [Egibacteraceae bacterium]